MTHNNTVIFNGQTLTIEAICQIASQQAQIRLSTQTDFIKRIDKGALFIYRLLKEQGFNVAVSRE